MGKIIEIRNDNNRRICDLVRESKELYLSVKCNDNKCNSKILKIKITTLLYHILSNITEEEKNILIRELKSVGKK